MTGFAQSKLAAGLQQIISNRREESGLYTEIIDWLDLPNEGRLLEAGCGSGLQLKVAREARPDLELYGLDISGAAIRKARQNLDGIGVDLRVGSVENTDYESGYFDIVTCFSSMSYWSNLVSCYNEVYRILKPGGFAKLIEPQKDIDIEAVVETIEANLAGKSRFRRFMAVRLNKFALQRGRKIGLRLYGIDEIEVLASKTRFGGAHDIQKVTLQNLQIFMLISLMKPA